MASKYFYKSKTSKKNEPAQLILFCLQPSAMGINVTFLTLACDLCIVLIWMCVAKAFDTRNNRFIQTLFIYRATDTPQADRVHSYIILFCWCSLFPLECIRACNQIDTRTTHSSEFRWKLYYCILQARRPLTMSCKDADLYAIIRHNRVEFITRGAKAAVKWIHWAIKWDYMLESREAMKVNVENKPV